jgi:hypothetical protein
VGTSVYPGTGNINKTPQFVNDCRLDTEDNNSIIDGGNDNHAYDDRQPPGLGTERNDMGAYGGPEAGFIGFNAPTTDDTSTKYIREDIIGTYAY